MARRIIATSLESRGAGAAPDTYFDRVIKYIPTDIVAAWIAVIGAIKNAPADIPTTTVLWIVFAAMVPFTAVWTWRQTEAPGLPPAISRSLSQRAPSLCGFSPSAPVRVLYMVSRLVWVAIAHLLYPPRRCHLPRPVKFQVGK